MAWFGLDDESRAAGFRTRGTELIRLCKLVHHSETNEPQSNTVRVSVVTARFVAFCDVLDVLSALASLLC